MAQKPKQHQQKRARTRTISVLFSQIFDTFSCTRQRLFWVRQIFLPALLALLLVGCGQTPHAGSSSSPMVQRSSVVTLHSTSYPSPVSLADKITEFTLPASSNPVPGAIVGPVYLTAGPDGNLWFTESSPNRIESITPTGKLSNFALTTPSDIPLWITAGPDGNLWFTVSKDKIGRITPTGIVIEFAIPEQPSEITTGPDGNLWFTSQTGNKIGRMTPSGAFTEFSLPSHQLVGDGPLSITSGSDGNLWFTESGANRIGRMTPTGKLSEFLVPIPTYGRAIDSGPGAITAGPDGNLWFTESDAGQQGVINRIGRITLTGTITEFTLPTSGSFSYPPAVISAGPDNNLWFTESGTNKIGRMTLTGTLIELPIPTSNSGPGGITAGPDGTLWFTESRANKIGRIT